MQASRPHPRSRDSYKARFHLDGYPTFTHGRSGGFEPVAGIAVAFIVTREIDAEAAVAAQVRLGALVQV